MRDNPGCAEVHESGELRYEREMGSHVRRTQELDADGALKKAL